MVAIEPSLEPFAGLLRRLRQVLRSPDGLLLVNGHGKSHSLRHPAIVWRRWRERAALASSAESGVVLADEYLRPLRALLLALQTNLLRSARRVPERAFQ